MPRQRMYSENVGGNWGLPAGYMETLTAPGRSYAAAISSVGGSIAGAITKYQEDKQAGEIRRGEFEANSEILARELNDKEGGVTEADVKTIENLARYESSSKGAQMAMNESVKVALKKSEREREIQRQDKQQQFLNRSVMRNEDFQNTVERRMVQGQEFGQKMQDTVEARMNRWQTINEWLQTRQDLRLNEAHLLNQSTGRFNLGQSQANQQAAERIFEQINNGIPVGGVPPGFNVSPQDIIRYHNPPPRPGTVQTLPGLPNHLGVTTGEGGGMNLMPTPKPDYTPIIQKDAETGVIYYINRDGEIKQLNAPKAENSFASFATLSIEKMKTTVEELQKMKLDGQKTARVDDNGVVHKSSWYRVDDDIDVLIQGFKQKMSDAARLGGNRGGTAGGADYTVDPNGKIVPIK